MVFHALGDPTRRTIVDRLSRGPASVSELAAPLPISLPAVVQHLHVLDACGLVELARRSAACAPAASSPRRCAEAEHWIAERRAEWERRLDRLGDVPRREPEKSTARRRRSR